jgi:predicted dienelactone hydrolase
MKPAVPAPSAFNASVILPLLPVFLLGAAVLSGSKKTLVTEAARRDISEKLAAIEAAPRGLPYGPYSVTRTIDVLLTDESRSKDVPVTVTSPNAGGPFPVIVFSHGAGGDGTQSEPLLRWWASHGYIVLSPTHSDSLSWQQRRSDLCEASGSDLEEGNLGLQTIVRLTTRDPQAGVQRARDISFVLDSLDNLEKQVPALAGRIDRAHVGVAGNSLGAYTAQLIGGVTVSVPSSRTPLSFHDPRARAVLQFSGQGTGQQGLTRESWKTVRLPMMTVTGSGDLGPHGRGAEWKREPFTFSPATGNKYHVFIEGAHHGSFGGRFAGRRGSTKQHTSQARQENVADQKAIFSYIEQTTLAFWDLTLKGKAAAKTLLDQKPTLIARQRGVTAAIDHK